MATTAPARPFRAVNPATGELLREVAPHAPAEVERRLAAAATAFAAWRVRPLAERVAPVAAAARILRDGRERWAALMTEEMGKPIAQGKAEADKCAWVCEWAAENAAAGLAPERRESDAREAYVRWDPLGPVLAVMPWNFPFWQVFRFAAYTLATGNVVLLKHAPNVPGCAEAIEGIWREAGLPEGVFANLFVSEETADDLVADERIAAVTLTGSERAGREVAGAAGRVVKKAVLELGGSDPFVVLADADLEAAAKAAVVARTINNGQTCIAAKRWIVHRAHLPAFEEAVRERLLALRVGDPADPDVDVGPLAREDLRDALHRQVRESVAAGARLVCGGEPRPGPGWFYPVTLLADVRPGMPAADEETFGPVAALLPAADDEDALRLANATPYGLCASVWTRDLEAGKAAAARIDAGCVFVNDFPKSDPRLPFGGVKRSGHGRELGVEGFRELANPKTVVVA